MASVDPQIYEQAGATFNVDPLLLRAVSGVESNENTAAVGPPTRYGNARGNMQFIDETAKRYNVVDPHEPVQAVFGGAAYLSDLLDKHKGDVHSALQEYNGATGDKGQVYAKAVAARYGALQAEAKKEKPQGDVAQAAPTSDVDKFLAAPPPSAKPAAAAPATAASGGSDTPDDVDKFLASPPPAEPGKSAAAAPAPGGWWSTPVADLVPPAVANFGSGVVQGARDVGQTIAGWERQANEAVPALAAIDRFTGSDPGRAENLLAGQTKEFEQQQGDSTAASIGRIGGNIGLTTAMLPVGIVGRGAASAVGAIAPRAANLVRAVTEGAVAGGGTNALTSGPSGQSPLAAAGEGALMGGALNAAMPVVRAGISAISGTTGSALKAIADRLGIELSTGQQLGGAAKRVEDASQILPFSGATKAAGKQNEQIAGVIAKEAGIPGPVRQLTTDVLNTAETRAGNKIEAGARQIDIPSTGPVGTALLNKLGNIETAARLAGDTTPHATAVRNMIDQITTIMSKSPGGSLPGAELQNLIRNEGMLERAMRSGTAEIRDAATGIRKALLDAAEATGGPGAAILREGRYNWKVIQTVRDAIDKTVDGSESMSHAKLGQLIRNEFNMKLTGPGNNMQDLARLLQGIKPLASSGTAERLATYGALGLTGAGAGAWYYDPDQMEDLMLKYGPHAAALLSAGRLMRFGPSMGASLPAGVAGLVNPLAPRVAGPLYRPPPPPSDNALAQP